MFEHIPGSPTTMAFVVERHRSTPPNRGESTPCRADRQPIHEPINISKLEVLLQGK